MALAEQILEGNRRRYTASFNVPDSSGVQTDPTTVTFYRRALGISASPETHLYGASDVVKDSVGVYHLDLDFPDAGRYSIGVQGTGTCAAYAELDVVVTNAKAHT